MIHFIETLQIWLWSQFVLPVYLFAWTVETQKEEKELFHIRQFSIADACISEKMANTCGRSVQTYVNTTNSQM